VDTELQVIDIPAERYVATLAISPDQALANYRAFQEFRAKVLRQGTDYSVIPGTDKPTLLKPGAEKLATAFALAVDFVLQNKVEDWDKGFFHYEYQCRLTHRPTGTLVATCSGSANTKESRYRWRTIPSWKASEADKARAVRTEQRRKKDGGYFTIYVVENDDPYTLVNTVSKMAQKRAFVGAVLLATNASDSFTQDLEDIVEEPAKPVETPRPPDKHEAVDWNKIKSAFIKDQLPVSLRDGCITLWTEQGLTTEEIRTAYAAIRDAYRASPEETLDSVAQQLSAQPPL
jgi:hypothetical protein